MAFTQLTNDLTTIEQLPDTPNRTSGYTAQQMKEAFDANAKIIKTYINETLLAELQSDGATSGYSGAKNIAVSSRSEFLTYRNIEDVLIYYRELIREAVSGEIGDDDIKTRMLDKSVGNEAVTTETIRNNAVTNAKLAGGISEDKIISLPTTKLTGTITNNQLAGSISYDKLSGGIRSSQLYGEIEASKLAGNIPYHKIQSVDPETLLYALPVPVGGTGATTANDARTNLNVSQQGYLTVNGTIYQMRIGTEGADGYITFVL